MRLIVVIAAVLLITVILLSAGNHLAHVDVMIHKNPFINRLVKYQIFTLVIAAVILFITVKLTPSGASLLKFGNLDTIAVREKWLGIDGNSSWRKNGLQLAFFISLATTIFMFFAVKHADSLSDFRWSFIPVVLIISLTNSFSEEIIYRFIVNGNLMNFTSKTTILILSGVLFGIPHYFGFPSGFIGVMMSAVLGYILSKATYETQGLGIAWMIHFIQDIIIFTSLLMMNVKE